MKALELKVPPVVVFLLAGAGMWLCAEWLPGWYLDVPGMSLAAAVLLVTGIAIGIAGVVEFRRAQTTVLPHDPERASTVVTGGVFRYTRNPMYLGLVLVLGAWGAKLGNVAALAGLAAFMTYMTVFQVRPEERILLAKFGEPFRDYMASVRRWI
ncbi:MAG: isoprenylcysteine carboxylmethyltransferase family protein [Woeseiaceae bacterium]|nr:isoprenylcysteine carboxylmethyltransferase family protein [Woeseiaceae bacterium]